MMKSFAVIGCGKMGQALVSRIAPNIDCPILCCDVNPEAREAMKNLVGDRVEILESSERIVNECDVVLVAVKPAQAPDVFVKLAFGGKKIILSIVAGIRHDTICGLAEGCEIVRIMPNTPAMVGAGSMVILDSDLSQETRELVENLLSVAGSCHFINDEHLMDAVTGLSGSSPALFAMLIEALADAAVGEGLPRKMALDLARETMLGTAKLLEHQHPAILKENVMSPNGTTAAGVLAAEKAGIRNAAAEFVCAATRKSRSMSRN